MIPFANGWAQEVSAITFTSEIAPVNAEDFKQGAKMSKASVSRRECVGTLLKIPLC